MLNPLDNYYAHLPEPERSCLQYPSHDLSIKRINTLLKKAIAFYK